MIAFALVVALAVAAAADFAGAARVTLQTPLGPVTGNALRGGVSEYVGIPYAESPAGNARFKPPTLVPAWSNALDATKYGAACPQAPLANVSVTYDEDCLSLNVWAPSSSPSSSSSPATQGDLPILFFIHGGSFVSGTGALYNGTAIVARSLAQKQPVVVVTINYRLGALGFLSMEEIEKEPSSHGATGAANGLLDQIEALLFTRKIASAFGGDIENINVFGESAGAISVCSHLVSPLAAGRFQRALIESGPCIGPWQPLSRAEALKRSEFFLKSLKVSTLAAVRAMPVATLLNASHSSEVPRPGVDGRYLDALPSQLLAAQGVWAQAVLLGSNGLDGLAGPPYYAGGAIPKTPAEFGALLRKYQPFDTVPGLSEQVEQLYPAADLGGASNAWFKLNSDVCVTCPTRWLADVLVESATPAYLYEFDGPNGLAPHAGELPYVFGGVLAENARPLLPAPLDPVLVSIVQDYWRTFAATGTPSASTIGGPAWYTFTSYNQEVMQMRTAKDISLTRGLRDPQCSFWNTSLTGAQLTSLCFNQATL